MPAFRPILLGIIALLISRAADAQSPKRVATLALGTTQILVDARADATVAITAVQNHLDARAVMRLADVSAWLDTALVVTAARDPRRRGVKMVYSAAAPALFLYRAVDVEAEEFIVSVGQAVKVSVLLGGTDARQLLGDIAAGARVAREMAASRGSGCSLGIAVALRPGVRLAPPDSAALWMDRVREQIEIRLATVAGAREDAGRGVWFVAEPDGNVTGVTPDTTRSPAVTALSDAITSAGGWHAFRNIPGGGPVQVRASLAPRCPA